MMGMSELLQGSANHDPGCFDITMPSVSRKHLARIYLSAVLFCPRLPRICSHFSFRHPVSVPSPLPNMLAVLFPSSCIFSADMCPKRQTPDKNSQI